MIVPAQMLGGAVAGWLAKALTLGEFGVGEQLPSTTKLNGI